MGRFAVIAWMAGRSPGNKAGDAGADTISGGDGDDSIDPDGVGGLGDSILNLIIQGQTGDSVTLDGGGGGNPDWAAGVTAQALAGYAGTYSIFYTTDGTVVAVEDDITHIVAVTISN